MGEEGNVMKLLIEMMTYLEGKDTWYIIARSIFRDFVLEKTKCGEALLDDY